MTSSVPKKPRSALSKHSSHAVTPLKKQTTSRIPNSLLDRYIDLHDRILSRKKTLMVHLADWIAAAIVVCVRKLYRWGTAQLPFTCASTPSPASTVAPLVCSTTISMFLLAMSRGVPFPTQSDLICNIDNFCYCQRSQLGDLFLNFPLIYNYNSNYHSYNCHCTTLQHATTTKTLHYTTQHYIQQLRVRWPLQPLQKS